ncbi:MAG: pyridoxal-phosphate dependent enzyme [Verrucomicrobia bacterium]|nr:pyridoxal-phosphate dependent enzyme [Verrucomicrobiota bacterium]
MKKTLLSQIIPKAGLHSRIHPLRSFPVPSGKCFVKREDELGFGISGTKVRKYLSFLPSLLKHEPDEAVIVGSAYSNHVLSLSQLLRENGVEPILMLLGDPHCKMQGNLLYSSLVAEPHNIHWISRKKWNEIDQIALEFAQERAKANIKTLVVPKGANCAEALPGAMSLGLDILRNEDESGLRFDHLLIDSGTGLTSCALALAFEYLERPTFLHILLTAGSEEEFRHTLAERKKDFEKLIGETLPSPARFRLYIPTTAPAFGSVNATVFRTIREIARREGFLTDPVFTAKLFYEGKNMIAEQQLKGNILFIHSGGGLGLTGFQEEMAKIIRTDHLESRNF